MHQMKRINKFFEKHWSKLGRIRSILHSQVLHVKILLLIPPDFQTDEFSRSELLSNQNQTFKSVKKLAFALKCLSL